MSSVTNTSASLPRRTSASSKTLDFDGFFLFIDFATALTKKMTRRIVSHRLTGAGAIAVPFWEARAHDTVWDGILSHGHAHNTA